MESSKSTAGFVSMTRIEILIGSYFVLNLSAHNIQSEKGVLLTSQGLAINQFSVGPAYNQSPIVH